MIPIQLIGLAIGIAGVHLTYLYYKRSNFTKKEVVTWLFIWLGFIFVNIFPGSVRPVVGYLGLQRPMDFIMIVAFIVLFSIAFYNYTTNRRQLKIIEQLVVNAALKNLKIEEDNRI